MSLYSTLWAENAYRQGRRTSLGGIFGHSAGSFFKMLILKLGFLDGVLEPTSVSSTFPTR